MSKYIFFWGGFYSQWYKSDMTIDGVLYNCCEQYMMHQKALLFNDLATAEKIMNTSDPKKQKQLGREVKDFDVNAWNKVCFNIVYKANYAKFTQNELLKNALLDTGTSILVEASPLDNIWGIGMGATDPGVEDPTNWKGQNLLGFAITLVKQQLKA